MTRFQPILLGSDINVYGMARAFHEEYGLVSEAYAYFQLSPTKFSRIVNVHIVDDFNNFVTFRNFMLKLGKRMKAEDPERVLLLIPLRRRVRQSAEPVRRRSSRIFRIQHA
mgnify:FL=1